MGTVSNINRAKFAVGRLVHHRMFDYRGVIVGVDQKFKSTDEWYEMVAKSRPPKNKPWYHVLVDNSELTTYVAERHLEYDESDEVIHHPMLAYFFTGFEEGRYIGKIN